MRKLAMLILALGAAPMAARAQTADPVPVATAAAVDPADVGSVDAILAALYGVISGDKGVRRDWARMESLFHPGARLIPAGRRDAGPARARVMTVADYIAGSGPVLEGQGFHEVEIARQVQHFGHIVHVWSTYEARRSLSDPQPLMRGINSIQLLDDGERFWILSIAWSQETPESPIPAEYLPAAQ